MNKPDLKPKPDQLSKVKIKIIIFNVINVLLVVVLIFLLNMIPNQASKVKELRSLAASQSVDDKGILESELSNNKANIEKITSVFIDEQGFLQFISSLDDLKARGLLTSFELPVSNPVIDSSKNLGLPVSITFAGTKTQIDEGLKEFFSLSYLAKPINVSLDIAPDGVITLRLGVFLYTNENFGKN